MAAAPATPWGVLLPSFDALHTGEPRPLTEAARLAESLGFDAGWVGDHLACNAPVIESTAALSAAAAVTDRLALGYSVMLLGLRAPLQAAHQIATVDALCGGRLSLGVGVGGEHPEEFAAAGVPLARRGRRLDAMLAVLPRLLAGDAVDVDTDVLSVHASARERPLGRMPRVIVGGRGDKALARAARSGDAWLPMWLSPADVAERAGRLRELAAEAGRPAPAVVLLALACVDEDAERARRVAAEHLQGQYRMPLEVVERWTLLGPAPGVAERLGEYLAAGVSELIVMPLGTRPLEQYERLAEVRRMLA